jgi:predicted RNA-binding Zn-ribbon protein involved in translation (DUF1610 family)
MKILSPILSVFLKPCPYCGKSIDIRRLRKIPRSAPLRWYQFTPAARTACPECGGFVKSTAADSPTLALTFLALLIVLLASIFVPEVRGWVAILPGGLYFFALPALLAAGFTLKHSELVAVDDED